MDTQTTSRRRRFVNVLVHLLFIIIIFVLPELVIAADLCFIPVFM